ncbi:MAG TPA: Clp protease N-terminal domain-containing protein, partial [Ignavibacteria bacterium]|nr:Clp protease N-terminal domain-containing protein [Ignavibacteria bacterium]
MAINFNKFTIKSQEAMQEAGEIAANYSNQQIEPAHLLAALIQNNESIAVSLILKIGANADMLRIKAAGLIEQLPKVSSATSGNQYLSNDMQKVLDEAVKVSAQLRDDYVSIEHLLIAVAEDKGPAGMLLSSQGINRESILTSLKDVRGSQRVTNQAPEET